MNIFLGLMLDFFAQQWLGGWYTCFLTVAVLQRLLKPHDELTDIFNLCWLSVGLIGFCVLDVMKYGRVGISLGIILLVFLLFKAVRHYFLSSQTTLLVLLTFVIVLLDLVFVRPLLSGLEMSWAVTMKESFGTLTTLTLTLLGARGSRCWLFVKNSR